MLGNHNWFLERVETEYALILPDDDLIHPELLERAVRVLDERPRAGTVHAGFDVIGRENEVLHAGRQLDVRPDGRRGREPPTSSSRSR